MGDSTQIPYEDRMRNEGWTDPLDAGAAEVARELMESRHVNEASD